MVRTGFFVPKLGALLCALVLGGCGTDASPSQRNFVEAFLGDGGSNEPDDAGAAGSHDAGREDFDAGASSPPDAGGVEKDAGAPLDDAGSGLDASDPGPDAGSGGFDAGTGADAGIVSSDAGTGNTDAGIPPPPVIVDLRVDTNRDGVVSVTDDSDESGEDDFSSTRGAIFLANIDDDRQTCSMTYSDGRPMADADLPKCHDAADTIVNGPDDLEDLARIKSVPWPQAPSDAIGRIGISSNAASRVRLFKGSGASFTLFNPTTATLSATELRQGVELAIEALDIVRDRAVWDGTVSVDLHVTATGIDQHDTVKLRVAPVMLFHHLVDVDRLFATNISGDSDSSAFQSALGSGLTAAGVSRPLTVVNVQDQWTQDFFETGFMSMPAVGGGQKVIRVAFRSANVYGTGSFPLRSAGRVVFALRGPDSAAIQQYDSRYDPTGEMDSLDSFGNTETIPPFTHNGVSYPMGRILRGSIPSFAPDPSFTKMLEAQLMQPLVNVDTSWLLVGHVDETISFIRASTPRGWVALVNDPRQAKDMLQNALNQGNGGVRMFVGKKWLDDYGFPYSAEVTVRQVLQDTDVMGESARSAAEVDAQVAILKAATGLTDAEIIRVPYLHYPVSGYSLGYQPGTVNGIVVNGGHFFAPDPHGPIIGGKDIFKEQLSAALAPYGVTVRYIEDWNLYHRLAGEVHCGTNAERVIPSTKWWESGR